MVRLLRGLTMGAVVRGADPREHELHRCDPSPRPARGLCVDPGASLAALDHLDDVAHVKSSHHDPPRGQCRVPRVTTR